MTNTVRARLVAAIKAALEGVSWIGSGKVFGVGAAMEEVVAVANPAAVLVLFGDDERLQVTNTVERLRVEVEVQVVFSPVDGEEPELTAADKCGDLYALYTGSDTAGTWGGVAMDTLVTMPVGGVSAIGGGLFVTAHVFTVEYGFRAGDPTVAE